METLATGSQLSDELIKALANTLMHSLWQGVLLAVAGGLIVIFTRKLSAALRYYLLTAAMLLFTCGTILTFFQQLKPLQSTHAVYKANNEVINVPVKVNIQPQITPVSYTAKQSITDTLIGYLNAHCTTIVLIWFLIICVKSIKLAVGFHDIYHLKHTKTYAVSKHWESRLRYLSDQLKIKQVIRLVESGIAKVPMVIGHLKPLILIPVGFINALSAEEVEAILVHELAHIRRRDYLVNLLQSFLEIIFFFNPAVMWISQLIKAERENCCDDIALKQAGSKSGYIQALLSCQEYQLAAPGLSMALARDKSKLLNRVKRMVNNHNQSLNIMEKSLLTICLVAAGFCTVAFSANKENKNNLVKVSALAHPKIKRLGTTIDKMDAQINGLAINDKKALANPVNNHAPQTAALLKQNEQPKQAEAGQIPVNDTSKAPGKIYNPADFNDGTSMNVRESKNGKEISSYLFKRDGVLYQVFMNHRKASAIYVDGKQKPVADYQSKIEELLDEYAAIIRPKAPIAPMRPMAAMPQMPTPPTPMAAMAPMPAKPMTAMVPMSPKPMPPMAAMAPMPPIPPVKPDGRFKEAADRLIEKGIIKDRDDFDMSLSNKSLKVDGALQPEDVHQEILKIFVKKPGDKVSWHYSRHESSESSEETTKK